MLRTHRPVGISLKKMSASLSWILTMVGKHRNILKKMKITMKSFLRRVAKASFGFSIFSSTSEKFRRGLVISPWIIEKVNSEP